MKRSALVRSSSPLPRSRLKPKRGTTTAKLKRDALKAWGAYIHARDVYCQRCGKADGKLDAHHVVIRSFAATCTDEQNGVLLCYRCHGLMHSDPLLALMFYSARLGTTEYTKLREKAYEGRNQTMRAAFWQGEIDRLTGLLEAL